jgi:hypothetical protein
MRILNEANVLDQRITDDPRWSEAQREAAAKAATADAQARCLGLDQKMRPVLTAKFGAARNTPPSQYAVLRNGAPAKPVMPLAEQWKTPTRRRSAARSTS